MATTRPCQGWRRLDWNGSWLFRPGVVNVDDGGATGDLEGDFGIGAGHRYASGINHGRGDVDRIARFGGKSDAGWLAGGAKLVSCDKFGGVSADGLERAGLEGDAPGTGGVVFGARFDAE